METASSPLCALLSVVTLARTHNLFLQKLIKADLQHIDCTVSPTKALNERSKSQFRDPIAKGSIFRPSLQGFSGKETDP